MQNCGHPRRPSPSNETLIQGSEHTSIHIPPLTHRVKTAVLYTQALEHLTGGRICSNIYVCEYFIVNVGIVHLFVEVHRWEKLSYDGKLNALNRARKPCILKRYNLSHLTQG